MPKYSVTISVYGTYKTKVSALDEEEARAEAQKCLALDLSTVTGVHLHAETEDVSECEPEDSRP